MDSLNVHYLVHGVCGCLAGVANAPQAPLLRGPCDVCRVGAQ